MISQKVPVYSGDYLLGIDPGVDTFSVAVYHMQAKVYKEFFTGTLEQGIEYCVKISREIDVLGAVMEDPRMNKRIFGQWEKLERYLLKWKSGHKMKQPAGPPKYVTTDDLKSVFGISMRHSSSVGANRLCAKIAERRLQYYGIPVLCINPTNRKTAYREEKGKKIPLPPHLVKQLIKPTKTNAAQFHALTGCEIRTNEHKRDAATLVWLGNASSFNLNYLKQVSTREAKERKKKELAAWKKSQKA